MRALRLLASIAVLILGPFGVLASLEPTATGEIHDEWLIGYAVMGSVGALILIRDLFR